MAAGQRKKKLNGASVARLNFHEHNVGRKKMKLESSDINLNMTSHVSLEWDDSQNKVVAKREQVGIAWRDMAPFLDHVQQFRAGLADVFSVPQEIFRLENIADVLSYEVWETSLSEQERKLLIQFLPRGVNVDNVVQSLLTGENFHFGNPFCKWGASLCAGNLHPDAVLHMEHQLRASRTSYFYELKKYHSGIIENLSKLEEGWTSCKNPEKEIAEMTLREGTTKLMDGNPSVVPEKTKILSSEKEQPHNTCFHDGDTTKYMSYIKINKKQHQLVKSLNQFGDGIQPKCLNRVLGDIRGFNIQPYEVFEEEERKRLHEHWLQVANKDLPAAFENRRECRLLRDKWRKCLEHELLEKEVMIKDEREYLRCLPVKQVDERDSKQVSPLDMQDKGYARPVRFSDYHHLERNPSLDAHQELSPTFSDQEQNLDILRPTTTHSINHSTDNCHEDKIPSLNSPEVHPQERYPSAMDKGRDGYIVEPTTPVLSKFSGKEGYAEDTTESKASPTNGHHLERIPSLNSYKEPRTVEMHVDGGQDLIKCTDNSPVVSQFLQCMSTTHDVVEEKLSASSSKDFWQGGSVAHSYHHYSAERQVCTSSGGLALQQRPPTEERSAQLIDLEAQTLARGAAESIASALHVNNRAAMFSSNVNQDHSLLLPHFHEGTPPSYLQEHLSGSKHSGLQFLATNDSLQQTTQFPHLFHGQQLLLKQNIAREKELYMQPIMNRNAHSSSRYPSRGQFLTVGSQDWTNLESPVNGGLMGHNWFTGGHDSRNDWSGAETSGTAGQCLGDAGSADGSLFSVLSECNKLPSRSPFATMGPERFLPGGNFGSMSNPCNDGSYTYTPLLNNASGRDAAALKMNSMPWMNFSLQNPGL